MPTLSVIVPVYNEAKTIEEICKKIDSVPLDKEIIVVDNHSTDGTDEILKGLRLDGLTVVYHPENLGKGSSVRTGIHNARGEFVVIQDADLEYDPGDYLKLMEAIHNGNADLVVGARFMKGYKGLWAHRLGNWFLTFLVNILFGVRLNDCLTCYKLFRREAIQALDLKSQGFDIEIEIIIKAIRKKLKIVETAVQYHPRSYAEGKKIRIKDGLQSALSILKYRISP